MRNIPAKEVINPGHPSMGTRFIVVRLLHLLDRVTPSYFMRHRCKFLTPQTFWDCCCVHVTPLLMVEYIRCVSEICRGSCMKCMPSMACFTKHPSSVFLLLILVTASLPDTENCILQSKRQTVRDMSSFPHPALRPGQDGDATLTQSTRPAPPCNPVLSKIY